MKTQALVAVLCVALFTGICLGYDITTRDGKVYKEIRLREKTALGIRIAHEGGVVFLDYSQIPVPDLWTFGYVEADYTAAKNPVPSGRPARLYQSTRTSPSDAEIQFEQALAKEARKADAANGRPPIGTTTLLSRPGGTAGSSSSGGRSAPSGGSSVSSAARGQCAATTKKGYRCSRMAAAGSSYCWQHP